MFFGYWEVKELNDGSYMYVWHHNKLLAMTREEQFKANIANDSDFCGFKHQSACGVIVYG